MNGLNQILKKIIRSGTGRTRFIVATVGLSVAIFLILASVQVQSDFEELLHGRSNQDSVANFLVINKVLNDQNIGAATLSDEDVKDLGKQPFVDSIGLLTPSRFKASIQSNSDRFPFSTDIAFETVPSNFLDVNSKEWHWDEQSSMVPIIVPNMFLDFYNFQFSFSQNMPQLTQQVVKMIVFRINVYGPNGMVSFKGHVVGFSDRLSSLLVPESFMQWGNQQFGSNQDGKPSRVIIRTKDPGNPALTNYLKNKGLNTDADKTRFSKYRRIVEMVVGISGITGVLMLGFALLIFSLFIQLTIASCKEEIKLLVELGSSPFQLQKFIFKQFFPVNIYIITIVFLLISMIQFLIHYQLQKQQIQISSFPSIILLISAVLILMIIWLINKYFIRKYINISA